MSEPGFVVRAEDQPAWAEIVRRAERGESVAVIAHGDHVADVVPSGEHRALYTVDDRARIVTVLAVAHRRDAYRPR